MSDIAPVPETTPEGAPPAGEPPAGAPPAEAPPAVGVAIPDDIDADLPDGVTQFDRAYVEKVRKEAADRRVKLKPYEETFGEASDDEREALLELNRLLLTDPAAGTRRMIELSRAIAGDEFESYLTNEPQALTADQAQKLWEENNAKQEQERQAQEAEQAVFRQIKDLGYQENSPEAANLVWRAYNQFEGDIDKAHEAIQGDVQKIIDSYVESKAGKNNAFPPVASGSGGGPADPAGGAPKSFAEARAAAEARMAAQAGR